MTRPRVNTLQLQKLLELMSEEGVLTDGRIVYDVVTRLEFWRKFATELNAIEGGVCKNPYKWCKTWADWKNKTKLKAKRILKKSYSRDEPAPALTLLEYKLLKLINYPVDRLSLEHMEGTVEIGKYELETMEFIVPESDYDNKPTELEDVSSLNNINTELNEDTVEDESDGIDSVEYDKKKRKQKVSEKKYKRKKLKSLINQKTPEEKQTELPYDIEQHRVRQKDEELRLRAIELKLKGQELKLKQEEMMKVNTLVNIEEEKLRCFRDVASLLRELVDRTKNGNPGRFNGIL